MNGGKLSSKADQAVRGLAIIRRVPFTLVMLLGIIIVAFITGATNAQLTPDVLNRWGFSLSDLWQGGWYSLVTEVLFTHSPFMFWGILALVICSIGIYEWQAGTRQACLLYWITDVGGTLIVSLALVLPLYLARTDLGMSLAFSGDVGMSGGGFGSLGGWIHRLPGPVRKRAFAVMALYLILHLFIITDLFSDILHLVTFPVGFWLDGWLSKRFTGK